MIRPQLRTPVSFSLQVAETATAFLAAAVAAATLAHAQEKKPPPEEPVPSIASSETAKLLALEGKTVRVTGFVENTGKSKSGNQFLNFSGSDFVTITFSNDVEKFDGGGPAEAYRQKTVAVTGPIKIYQGIPEIVVREPGQITVIDPSEAVAPEPRQEPDPEPEPPPALEPKPLPPESAPAPASDPPGAGAPPPPVDWRKYFPE